MLTIRMQRTGRKRHAMFRVVVQDAHVTPTSGKIVAQLGSYDPHAKNLSLDKEKASFYLEHGAQPSERAARLLAADGVKMPKWVTLSDTKKRTLRNPAKLRKNQPKEEKPVEAEAPAEEAKPEAPTETAEAPAPEAAK